MGKGVQKIVGRHIVKTAKGDEVVNGHLIGASLIPGIHGLRGTENLSYLLLSQVIVLPKSPQFFNKRTHSFAPTLF